MNLTQKQKDAIQKEYDLWKDSQYSGKDKAERSCFGQYFTPPVLTIKMLEKFDSIKDKDILDPTVGAAGLLAACIICGADPNRIYGVELDPEIVVIARKRLSDLVDKLYKGRVKFPIKHIKLGNALNSDVFEDFDNYEDNVEALAAEAKAKRNAEKLEVADDKPRHSSSKKEKPKAKLKSKEKPKAAEAKTSQAAVDHDQDAISISVEKMYSNIDIVLSKISFPDKETSKKTFSIVTNGKSKKPVMSKLAKEIEDCIAAGCWTFADNEFNDIKTMMMLNDIDISILDSKILKIALSKVADVAKQQMFDSYDDFAKLS